MRYTHPQYPNSKCSTNCSIHNSCSCKNDLTSFFFGEINTNWYETIHHLYYPTPWLFLDFSAEILAHLVLGAALHWRCASVILLLCDEHPQNLWLKTTITIYSHSRFWVDGLRRVVLLLRLVSAVGCHSPAAPRAGAFRRGSLARPAAGAELGLQLSSLTSRPQPLPCDSSGLPQPWRLDSEGADFKKSGEKLQVS